MTENQNALYFLIKLLLSAREVGYPLRSNPFAVAPSLSYLNNHTKTSPRCPFEGLLVSLSFWAISVPSSLTQGLPLASWDATRHFTIPQVPKWDVQEKTIKQVKEHKIRQPLADSVPQNFDKGCLPKDKTLNFKIVSDILQGLYLVLKFKKPFFGFF